MLVLHNSLTGKKEPFKPLDPSHVKLYVCGITPYDGSHLGHGRGAVIFDMFYRFLSFLDYKVCYCRNVTDIDDKLLIKAEQLFGDRHRYQEIAQKYTAQYAEQTEKLHCVAPNFEPRVTDNIPQIIQLIEQLIERDFAYESNGDVYFAINKFESYGRLSKQQVNELRAGARVEPNEQKRDPLDFALWKAEPHGEFWQSPWGYGRPGWHIECSALARTFLGEQLDVHGGGLDLIFPHHENERAQSEAATGKPFAHCWLHNGLITVGQEKMSKSLGNVQTLEALFQRYDPVLIRYYILAHHYRAPLDFMHDNVTALQKSYNRLCKAFEPINPHQALTIAQLPLGPVVRAMLDFLYDDLNTVGMFGVLFNELSVLQADPHQMSAVKRLLISVLGLPLREIKQEVEMTPEIQELLRQREQARKDKNWALSDALRDKLAQLGYSVQDKKL